MATNPERVVFLDTSEIMARGMTPLFAADLRRIGEKCAVVTSTLVLDELEANYRRDHEKVTRSLARYFPMDQLPNYSAVRREFANRLRECGVKILDVTVPLVDVIAADLRGGKPFNESGKGAGYRDFVNWMVFVDHVKACGAGLGSFLTQNHKDFMDGGPNGGIAESRVALAERSGCRAELEIAGARRFFMERFPPPPQSSEVAAAMMHLDGALRGWLGVVEDGELARAMGYPGLGPCMQLQVLDVRDTDAKLIRGPEAGIVQMRFRATFDCQVIADARYAVGRRLQPSSALSWLPWVLNREALRLEWTVEAPFDEKRGITGMPRQIAGVRRLDPATSEPLD